MVKIRLRRIGTKGRPFYRVVVAKSAAGRNGAFVETIGTYNPIVKPSEIHINEERALHWLMTGAQPTETTAYLLNKVGVLPKFFEARPAAKKSYSFLDKRTAAMSKKSAIDANQVAATKAEPAPAAVEAAPVIEDEPIAEAVAEVEAPVAEVEAPSEPEVAVEAEAPAETAE
jgi:small subunit ribosomal protein S16